MRSAIGTTNSYVYDIVIAHQSPGRDGFLSRVLPLRLPWLVYGEISGQECVDSSCCTSQMLGATLKGSSRSVRCLSAVPTQTELRRKVLNLDVKVGGEGHLEGCHGVVLSLYVPRFRVETTRFSKLHL